MDNYIKNIVLYKQIVKNVLEDKLYEQVYQFFKDILLSNYDIKLFMARKCYCLFKVFKPIFENEFKDQADQLFENVLNDRSLFFNANKIKEKEQEQRVLIIDDTMKFGRSAAQTIKIINDCFGIDNDNINICIFAIMDTYLKEEHTDHFAHFTKDSTFVYKNRFIDENPKSEFSEIAVYNGVYFYDENSTNRLSARFIEAIHAVGESYSGYSPYFYVSTDDVKGLDCYADDLKNEIKNKLQQYIVNDITVAEQKNNNVAAFLLRKENEFENKNDGCLYAGVRVVINRKLERITVIPLAVIPDLRVSKAYDKFISITGYNIHIDERIKEFTDSVRYNSILYVYGYLLAQHFIQELIQVFGTSGSKTGTYLNNDFQCSTMLGLQALDLHINYDFTDVFSEKAVFEKGRSFADKFFDEVLESNTDKNVFNLLSIIFYKLVTADSPLFKKEIRFSIYGLMSKIQKSFKVKFNTHITADSFFADLVKTFELGLSGTRIYSDQNCAYSCVQEGEAGNHITHIPINGLHTSLNILVDELTNRNIDNLSSVEFKNHKENIRKCFNNYVKVNSTIDTRRLDLLFESHDVKACDISKCAFYDVNADPNYRFFINFARYYLQRKPESLPDFKGWLESEKKKISVTLKDEREIENYTMVLNYIPVE